MVWVLGLIVLLNSVFQTHKKWLLQARRLPLDEFLSNSGLILAVLALFTIPFWQIDVASALSPRGVGLFFGMVATTILFAWLYYGVLRREQLGRLELFMMLTPVFVFLVAGLFLPEERDPGVWLAGGLGTLALFYAHAHGHRIRFDRYEKTLVIVMLIMALQVVFIRQLLDIYSPISLYATRAMVAGLITPFFFGWHLYKAISKRTTHLFITSLGSFLTVPLVYVAYREFGVSITQLAVSLVTPLLLYFCGRKLFGEHHPARMAFAGVIILVSVGYFFIVTG